MNRVTLIGNLGNDAELKTFGDGNSVLNFSVATSEKWTDKVSGEKKEKTEWHRCKLFGKRAGALANHLLKGTKIAVTGSIETRSYDKDGQKLYVTEIKVLDVEFCGGPKNGGGQAAAEDPDGLGDPGDAGDGAEIPF